MLTSGKVLGAGYERPLTLSLKEDWNKIKTDITDINSIFIYNQTSIPQIINGKSWKNDIENWSMWS